MNAVDEFIIYDNIKYTKKGWINRNRILMNGKDQMISLPLKKDSDYLNVNQRFLSNGFEKIKNKTLSQISNNYRKAPYFNITYDLISEIFNYQENNLFKFILNSLTEIKKHLSIDTNLVISSTVDIDHSLQSQNKVLALCQARKAQTYINPIGGTELYSSTLFLNNHIELKFLKTNSLKYQQFKNEFIPFLSIIDIMMFNSLDTISQYLNMEFEFVKN
jgi:hypothetical protein